MAENEGLFETPIDSMMKNLEKSKRMSFSQISKDLKISIDSVEKLALLLEKKGLLEVHYSVLITSEPYVVFEKKLSPKQVQVPEGKSIEEYSFEVDSIPLKVSILRKPNEQRPIYFLNYPVLGEYTQAFVEELKDEIAEKVPVEVSEITDIKMSDKLKKRFFDVARNELEIYLKEFSKEKLDILAGLIMHSMYGLGRLELVMGDNMLEEVTVNSSVTPVVVYQRKHGWLKSNILMSSEEEIYNYSSQIARKVGREITTLNPILDAHLSTGDRVNATLSPISTFGNTITIRRFARRPWTVIDFIGASHTMNVEMASLLWLAMQYEMNILVAGGTASGKTSALNALSAFMPNYHRILSIEDVREIMLPDYLRDNWVPMTTRNPNPEGQGEVTMLDLMQSSLRMRPDRIILGEIRRQKEAEVLFEAMHTGHSVYSTIHSNSADQVLKRLTEKPISIPPLEVEALDLILVQYRDRRRNVRRTFELAEVETGVAEEQLAVNTIYKWQPREDSWESMNLATKFVRNLNLHTGMTENEIEDELESRATILEWMLKNKLNDINQVGKVMGLFYSDPVSVREAAEKGVQPKKILGV